MKSFEYSASVRSSWKDLLIIIGCEVSRNLLTNGDQTRCTRGRSSSSQSFMAPIPSFKILKAKIFCSLSLDGMKFNVFLSIATTIVMWMGGVFFSVMLTSANKHCVKQSHLILQKNLEIIVEICVIHKEKIIYTVEGVITENIGTLSAIFINLFFWLPA